MPALGIITASQLSRCIGPPDAPILLDLRTPEDASEDPRIPPASRRASHADVADWAPAFRGKEVVVICQKG